MCESMVASAHKITCSERQSLLSSACYAFRKAVMVASAPVVPPTIRSSVTWGPAVNLLSPNRLQLPRIALLLAAGIVAVAFMLQQGQPMLQPQRTSTVG